MKSSDLDWSFFFVYLRRIITRKTIYKLKNFKLMIDKNKIFTLIISGILFAYILFQSYHQDNIFQIFIYPIIGGIGLYTFYKGYFDDIKRYEKTKKLKSYSITIIGLFLVILNLGIVSYYEIKLNSKTLFKVVNHGVYGDFKKNGEYIIKSGSWASRKHFYGKYSIIDSLITIDRKKFDDVLITDKFVIRNISNVFGENDNGKTKKYLIQLNDNNKEIKNRLSGYDKSKNEIYDSYFFEVIEDNRK